MKTIYIDINEVEYKPGNCYQDAFNFITENQNLPNIRLVHGHPTLTKGPDKGKPYHHAWCEFALVGYVFCVDMSRQNTPVPSDLYYLAGRINRAQCHFYTLLEACENVLENEFYGPWHETTLPVLIGESA